MRKSETERLIQEKLTEARALLVEVGQLVDHSLLESVDFMGLVYENRFGWFHGEDLQEESEWNQSSCVIGSKMGEHGTMDWQSSASSGC